MRQFNGTIFLDNTVRFSIDKWSKKSSVTDVNMGYEKRTDRGEGFLDNFYVFFKKPKNFNSQYPELKKFENDANKNEIYCKSIDEFREFVNVVLWGNKIKLPQNKKYTREELYKMHINEISLSPYKNETASFGCYYIKKETLYYDTKPCVWTEPGIVYLQSLNIELGEYIEPGFENETDLDPIITYSFLALKNKLNEPTYGFEMRSIS